MATELSTDVLAKNYQNQIMNRLSRRPLYGILTDSRLTDIRFTIADGKSHKKHTEGGDFRRATEIAVRDALLRTENVLLEPFYQVTLVVPAEAIGRAMTDFERMKGTVGAPEPDGEMMRIEGRVPVRFATDYAAEVAAYTGGLGSVWMRMAGYFPAIDADAIIEEIGYDYHSDLAKPYESVYVHGMSVEAARWEREHDREGKAGEDAQDGGTNDKPPVKKASASRTRIASLAEEDELMAIFTRTFGEGRRPAMQNAAHTITKQENVAKAREAYLASHPTREKKRADNKPKKKYLLVDGYNVIFAWDDLRELADINIDSARDALIDVVMDYQGFTGMEVIVVFDAYKVKNNPGSVEMRGNIHIVYTKEAQTADAYIERATHEIIREQNAEVSVVTSDGLVQLIVIGAGARRISSREFADEVKRVRSEGVAQFKNQC